MPPTAVYPLPYISLLRLARSVAFKTLCYNTLSFQISFNCCWTASRNITQPLTEENVSSLRKWPMATSASALKVLLCFVSRPLVVIVDSERKPPLLFVGRSPSLSTTFSWNLHRARKYYSVYLYNTSTESSEQFFKASHKVNQAKGSLADNHQ